MNNSLESVMERWTREDKEQLKELYIKEASIDAIARKLGRSQGTVTAMASTLGISRPKELLHLLFS